MIECNMCGKCCEAIILNMPYDIIKKNEHMGEDYIFIKRNWQPISEKEALDKNPWLRKWKQKHKYYYKCRHYCEISKKCIVHSIRPHICSEFPRYGNKKTLKQCLYSKECSFHKDM